MSRPTPLTSTTKTNITDSKAALLRIPLLCIACLWVLHLDGSSLKHVRGLYHSLDTGTHQQNQHDEVIDKSSNDSNNINETEWSLAENVASLFNAIMPDMPDITDLLPNSDEQEEEEEEDDLHYSQFDILDLLDWEEASLTGLLDHNATATSLQATCQPPDGVSKTCCLGSFSAGGGVTDRFRRQCVAPMQTAAATDNNKRTTTTGHAHQGLQQATRAFFRANQLEASTKQRCDICRIVDLARHQNLSIALMGDSMHSQIADGFMCELQRRNYNVTSEYIDHNPEQRKDFVFRRHSLSQVLRIQSPTWDPDQTVTIQYHMMYLLPLVHDAVLEMTAHADVVVLGFGLHWWDDNETPFVFKRQTSYISAMRDLFHNITEQNRVKLLVHRETTAQHFDANGGEFSTWWKHRDAMSLSKQCQPMNYSDRSVGWRETAIQQAANQSGHRLVVAGPHMPPLPTPTHAMNNNSRRHGTSTNNSSAGKDNNMTQQHTQTQPEIVVLPYFNFTSHLHTLHPVQDNFQDCTHYCSSPFIYYPIWRSLRFAMERQFGGV